MLFRCFVRKFFFKRFRILTRTQASCICAVPISSRSGNCFINALIRTSRRNRRFFITNRLEVAFTRLKRVEEVCNNGQPTRYILVFPTRRTLRNRLTGKIRIVNDRNPFCFFHRLFITTIRILLPNGRNLCFPFIIFCGLIINLPSSSRVNYDNSG